MDGVLIIDKAAGPTSHDVVSRVRRILREKRIGHTGTLDPFATGVLVLMVGQATRIARFLNTDEKEYQAVIRFGYSTDTGDCTGTPAIAVDDLTKTNAKLLSNSVELLKAAMKELTGTINQVPPMYSAKKIGGKKLYELARRGETIEREAVAVTISRFEMADDATTSKADGAPFVENDDGSIDLKVVVACSAGTYIRVLAEDLASLLGTRAHLASLRRTRAGRFDSEGAITLDHLSELVESGANIYPPLIPISAAIPDMHFLHLSIDAAHFVRQGRPVSVGSELAKVLVSREPVRMIFEEDDLVAIGEFNEQTRMVEPRIVFAPRN